MPGPLNEEHIFGQLCKTGPFIYVLKFDGGGGHSLVVKDSAYINGELFLWVHDHSWKDGTNPRIATPVYRISYKDFVAGVWGTDNYIHDFDYVQIKPK